MARLSVEHYRSNTGTLQPERRSSRFREIFKHRLSSSVSSSPNRQMKPQTASSPLASPMFRPGFEKIGLLPCERSSIELTQSGVLQSPGSQTLIDILEKDAKDVSSLRKNSLGASKNDEQGSAVEWQTAAGDKKEDKVEILSSPVDNAMTHNDFDLGYSPLPSWDQDINKVDADKSIPPLRRRGRAAAVQLSTMTDAARNTLTGYNPERRRKSYASNIFDDNDSLSQGIREYVTCQIAKSIVEHESKLVAQDWGPSKVPVHLTFDVNVPNMTQILLENTTTIDARYYKLWGFPTSIGPIKIKKEHTATTIQNSLAVFISILMLGAAFSGPKDLFLLVWRMAVALSLYALAAKYFQWCQDFQQDLLLAPFILASQKICFLVKEIFKTDMQKLLPVSFAEGTRKK